MGKNRKVDSHMQALGNPHKDLWEEIRDIILSVDPKMEEDLKWGAPTFIFKGNLTTFNPRAKKFVNLTFHIGAEIPDPEGVFERDAKEARVFRVVNREELNQKKSGVIQVVRNWIELKS